MTLEPSRPKMEPEGGRDGSERGDNRTTRSGLDQSRLTHLVGYAATRASVELKKTFQKHLGPLKLKAVEFSILVLVASNPKVNQKQLCQSLDVSAPNMALTLDRLVERGWVARVRSTEDRRSQEIHLTPAGRLLVQRAEKIAGQMEREATGVLTEAERLLLIELLLRIARGRTAAQAASAAGRPKA
jgi:DNA-binding MarR family transcriptional regulator